MRDNGCLVTLSGGCKTRLNALNARVGKNLFESHVSSHCEQLIGSHVTPFSETDVRQICQMTGECGPLTENFPLRH